MSIRDFFRNAVNKVSGVAKSVYNGVGKAIHAAKAGAQKVFGVGAKIADTVKNVYDKATHIPVIGNAIRSGAEKLMSVKIPRTNVSIGQALQTGDKIVHAGDRLLNK
jgi:phage-related protein